MVDIKDLKTLFDSVRQAEKDNLNPIEAELILRYYGIDVTKSAFSRNNLDEIIESSKDMDFPMVLKLISSSVLHKSDTGFVHLNLNSEKEITKAYHEILKSAGIVLNDSEIEGFLVQEMVQDGYELVVGLATDPTFGKIIMFGLGGIFVEILKDVAIRKIPITPSDAQDMMEEIRGYEILKGARGKEPANIELIRDILLNVSRLGLEIEEIEEMDLNPIFVSSNRALVADSRIILSK